MITPLMLLLSSINQQYENDSPVDTTYLNRSDRKLILEEADRLGRMATDENIIMMVHDRFGVQMADTAQVMDDHVVDISLATAMMLTRIATSYEVFKKSVSSMDVRSKGEEADDDDLGTDSVILLLEGNPRYVYSYVYNLMITRGVNYSAKIMKIVELYTSIISHMDMTISVEGNQNTASRLELQSTYQFWQGLILSEMLKHGLTGNTVTFEDIHTVKQELSALGFYGFVNPYKMFMDFSGSRISRKVGVNIDPEVVDFLEKIVRSGGVQ